MFKAPAKFSLVETEETSLSNMSATCSPFRRPKGKGGTKSGINLVHGTIGIENGQHTGGARNNFNTDRQHNHFAQEYKVPNNNTSDTGGRRRRRTAEDFLTFCKMVLDYENYDEVAKREEIRRRNSCSPLGSTGSSNESWLPSKEDESDFREKASSEEIDYGGSVDSAAADGDVEDAGDEDDEGWDMITCFCGKPFAGRPMIECSGCYTWIHIKCARVKRTHIPEVWYCTKCREDNPGLVSSNITKPKKIKLKSTSGSPSVGCLSSSITNQFRVSLNEKGDPIPSDSITNEKITGSRKRKMSSSITKVNTYNKDSTKVPVAPALAENSREKNCNVANSSVSDFSDKHSTSSVSSCPPAITNNSSISASQSNGVEKSWDDSGLESASVSPVSGPRQSEEETDSASSYGSGQLIPLKRSAKKKKLPSNAIKDSCTKRRRSNSITR